MVESIFGIAGLAGLTGFLILVVIWDIVWKGIALWKSARNEQNVWFVFLLIINSAGILPIIYLVWFQKKVKNIRKKKR